MDLFYSFKTHVRQNSLLQPGDRVVAGVSGGVDSIVLLDLLDRLRPAFDLTVVVAHLNHRLRGREADRDAAFVEKEAKGRGLSFQKMTLSKTALKEPGNRQARARALRYAFFAQVAKKRGVGKILTAHQADDQVETFFMRLIRGSGPEGLKGIAPARTFQEFSLIRPLLPFTREAILRYARQRRLRWREDASNAQEDYLRNRIRKRLSSQIRALNPKALESIAQALEIFREEEVWIDGWLRERAKGRLKRRKGGVTLPLLWLKVQARPMRYRLYRMGLQEALGSLQGISRRHLDMIEEMVIKRNEEARVSLPRGFGARVTKDEWILQKWSRAAKPRTRGFFC